MDEALVYPLDEETGLPHLLRLYDPSGSGSEVRVNYDHSWFPRMHEQLRDFGGRAVRYSMGQVIPVAIHRLKNKRFDSLPWLPRTDDQKFETVVKGISGVVSRWAVDVRRPDANLLVRLDDAEFAFLTDRTRLHRENALRDRQANVRRDNIGAFLVHYSIQQGLRDILTDSLIDQFLSAQEELRRKELGNLILTTALTARLSPLVASHDRLRRRGMVRPNAPTPVVAVRKFIRKTKLPDYFPSLVEKLQPTH